MNYLVSNHLLNNEGLKNFILCSILIYIVTFFIVCDPNPFSGFLFYYIFYPNFIKAITITFIHTYFLSSSIKFKSSIILSSGGRLPDVFELRIKSNKIIQSYFLSGVFKFLRNKRLLVVSVIGLILFFFFNILLFEQRISLWVYFNTKEKTLPISNSKNRIFYITSSIVNAENIIENFIEEMKKLIHYLGYQNVIISIVENGDSVDNTRKYLSNFQNYLNKEKILNRFILEKEIEDIRKNKKPYIKGSRLRIEFYSKLRNKCLDYLYELTDINYDNVIIIFFNDIVFRYEDIINLLSTNKEDFDCVCGLDVFSDYFYDRWVSIDLDGNGLYKYFPYFINKEAQDLVYNHKPIRVFSCWNGIIAFKASPLKAKQIKFRHKINYTIPKYFPNNPVKEYYESECIYLHIDLFSLGYNKRFINPDVRVSYRHKDYLNGRYYIPSFMHILFSFILYFVGFCKKRNRLMSNYVNQNIKLNSILKKWYIENRLNND